MIDGQDLPLERVDIHFTNGEPLEILLTRDQFNSLFSAVLNADGYREQRFFELPDWIFVNLDNVKWLKRY